MAIIRGNGERSPETPVLSPLSGFERVDPFRLMNELLRWDPFRSMREVALGTAAFVPAFDVRETQDNFLIEADVPGLKEKDLNIQLVGRRLTISGQRESERRDQNEQVYTWERQYGAFTRSFTLPEGVDVDHIDASVEDGVLRIVLPKSEKIKPRKISIKERVKQALKS